MALIDVQEIWILWSVIVVTMYEMVNVYGYTLLAVMVERACRSIPSEVDSK